MAPILPPLVESEPPPVILKKNRKKFSIRSNNKKTETHHEDSTSKPLPELIQEVILAMEQEEERLKKEEEEFLKEREAIRLRKPLAAPPQMQSPLDAGPPPLPPPPDASLLSPAPPPLPPKEERNEEEEICNEEEEICREEDEEEEAYLAEKELPIIERLSLEDDYPNRTVDPAEIFSTEYRDRSNMHNSSQWFFDEFSGLYRQSTPSLYQSLPNFQTIDQTPKQVSNANTFRTLSRSNTTTTTDRSSFALKLKLSNIEIGSSACSRSNTISSMADKEDWPTPTTIEEVHSLKKRVHSMRDRRKKLDLCRILMDTACQGETTVYINASPIPGTPPVSTRYSRQELRRKKKGDLILDEVLVLEAQKILKKLAIGAVGHNTDGDAQFLLANCYGVGGLGLRVDRERAFSLYIHASKQNHIESTYRAAVCYEIGIGTKRDYNRAMVFYRKAANLSHVASMYKLGVILLRGFCGQVINIRESIAWLQRAASLANTQNPHALYVLALFQFMEEFSGNDALIADIPYALELLHEAAQLEYLPSQVKLGELYEIGGPVEVDDALSVYWYTRAAEQGNADAALALSSWYLTGSSGILPQSDREAYLWARKAASSQFADRWTIAKAYFLIGIYVDKGIGINQKSKEEAKVWFKKSAALGHKGAVEMIEGNHIAMLTVT